MTIIRVMPVIMSRGMVMIIVVIFRRFIIFSVKDHSV
jgi:hypothetical protein